MIWAFPRYSLTNCSFSLNGNHFYSATPGIQKIRFDKFMLPPYMSFVLFPMFRQLMSVFLYTKH